MPGTSTKQDDATSDAKAKVVGPEDSKQGKKSGGAGQNDDKQKQEERSNSTHQRRTIATTTSLFVTGFAHAINKTHVQRLFSKYGTTERISDFMTSQKSTSNSRYCFVEYDSIESAQKAMDNLNGRTLLHKRLVVLPAHANTDDNSSSARKSVPLNPKKERILLDQKIAALKKKIKESNCD
mmetsp:Transcript_22282/g.55188  ORF Transcript_22282/g.55188 Transcript_22282/m.55188 type:complete len:181 (+) Transcript_22282:90-632(+)